MRERERERAGESVEKEKEVSGKKQVPLRLSSALWNDLVAWSEDEFRSLNGQIEYLLSEAVKRRKQAKNPSENQ
jgi:hypothetical protein